MLPSAGILQKQLLSNTILALGSRTAPKWVSKNVFCLSRSPTGWLVATQLAHPEEIPRQFRLDIHEYDVMHGVLIAPDSYVVEALP